MLMHMFYVADEDGTQISDDDLGEINDFLSFRVATAVARKYSKNHEGRFMVGVCVPSTKYESGKIFNEV